jgi:hypothetical protein
VGGGPGSRWHDRPGPGDAAQLVAVAVLEDEGSGDQGLDREGAGNYDTDTLIEKLGELRRFLGGEKATLLWDGLPAQRSTAMGRWLNSQRSG